MMYEQKYIFLTYKLLHVNKNKNKTLLIFIIFYYLIF